MNALRAPLTALPTQRKKGVYFLLDMADDFIDVGCCACRRWYPGQFLPGKLVAVGAQRHGRSGRWDVLGGKRPR